jgi:hypothetical protein
MSTAVKNRGSDKTVDLFDMERECAACGLEAEGDAGTHRDGFCDGPQVWLCNPCGLFPEPPLEHVWALIAARRPLAARCYQPGETP